MNIEIDKKFLIYEAEDNKVVADVLIMDENIWMTQKQMAQVFDVGVPAVSKHLSNIFNEGELEENRTVSKMEIVQNEGNRTVKREIYYYNVEQL
ncbi:hypothetical protein [uncultured Ezakiella sp.]|uniref:hypothetical protein n=1 Tax=uncultured Ezakiella sp. TaxID=1637529 RepID=UPI0025FF3C79|nr:hypothetical protein [uncultured Ezakiella sp.]